MRKSVVNLLLVAAIVLLVAITLYIGRQQDTGGAGSFAGSDSRAMTEVEKANPDYEAWAEPVFEPAAGEIESGLFALQAALGAGVLGFALGALWQRSRTDRSAHDPAAGPAGRPGANDTSPGNGSV